MEMCCLEYFEGPMNEENEIWLDDVGILHQVRQISKEEVRAAMKRIKRGQIVGPNDILHL